MRGRIPLILVLALVIGADGPAASDAPYVAVLADGTRVEGTTIHGWHTHTGGARLDSTSLADVLPGKGGRPLRWFCDRTLGVYEPDGNSPGFVEFATGDRLPGRVIGFQEASFATSACLPAHLLVEPAVEVSLPNTEPLRQVRVLIRNVRRVGFGGVPRRRIEPKMIFYRDGRRVAYRSLRWGHDSVTLLTEDGVRRAALADVAEIHLPSSDPWQAYYEELAALNPDGSSRLMRLQTASGLVATDSVARFRAAAHGSEKDSNHWHHMVQPAWSLDPLWIRFREIRTRLYFAVDEVPLSRLQPSKSVSRPLLSGGAQWQADRNVQGSSLSSGGREYLWGFGVQAWCELWFDLPSCVRAFRSRAGLDRLAGTGGCARAMVYVNRASGKPLYRSNHLIGSQQVVDTGSLSLSGPASGQQSLILLADSAHRDHPPGADPLDIRDMLDWLEPVLLLDRGKLKREVQQAIARAVPAWDGWTATVDGGGEVRLDTIWDTVEGQRPCHVLSPLLLGNTPGSRTLTLSTHARISAADHWLLIRLREIVKGTRMDTLEVRVDGRSAARIDVPPWEPAAAFWVPMPPQSGREVKIEVIYKPGDEKRRIQWQALTLVKRPAATRWTGLKPSGVWSLSGATLEPQPDGSLLVEGAVPPNDVYTIIAEAGLPKITALRLEALPDASLPGGIAGGGGPGRADDGNFVLSRFSVAVAPRRLRPIEGRFVRIDLPKPPLSLAEVQVISQGKNVAPGGTATQSSTKYDASAPRAIDNNTDGNLFNGKSVTHTSDDGDFATQPAWWEVDLGAVKPIDNLALWNRTDGSRERLSNFHISVLDAQRKTVWEKTVAGPPDPYIELDNLQATEIPLQSAAADFEQDNWPAEEAVKGPSLREDGWSIGPQARKRYVVVFVPEKPIDVGQSVLVLKLKHVSSRQKHSLGRFRLSITGDEPPESPESNPVAVPLLPE